MYYGTEILMKGFTNPDGLVRLDFPGGWSGDTKNAFTGEGLNSNEKEVQALVRKLGQYRKECAALQTGQTMQYVPQNGLYVYFRYDAHHTIMCVMNTAESEMIVDFSRFRERTKGFSIGKDVCGTEAIYQLNTPAKIPGTTMWVLELQ